MLLLTVTRRRPGPSPASKIEPLCGASLSGLGPGLRRGDDRGYVFCLNPRTTNPAQVEPVEAGLAHPPGTAARGTQSLCVLCVLCANPFGTGRSRPAGAFDKLRRSGNLRSTKAVVRN